MQIGILQTGHAPSALAVRSGDYADLFQQLLAGQGFEFRVYPVLDMQFPDSVHDCDGWLITGSRHGVYEDHAFIPPLEDFIRTAYAERVPLVGICFGHQIVAQALGGRVEKFSGGWSVGPNTYEIEGRPVTLNAWHQDQVVEKPAAAEVVGTSPFCANAALVYGDRIFTLQPHPEFDADFLFGLIELRGRAVVPAPLIARAEAALGQPLDRSATAARIGAFFKQPRAEAGKAETS